MKNVEEPEDKEYSKYEEDSGMASFVWTMRNATAEEEKDIAKDEGGRGDPPEKETLATR